MVLAGAALSAYATRVVGWLWWSANGGTIAVMRLLASDVEKIPVRNLRVPLREFVVVWIAAERIENEGRSVWYSTGVLGTCRWLANATVRPIDGGPWRMAVSPATRREASAYEELIEAECLAAERMLFRRPVDPWVRERPGWMEGILATLRWAWRHDGPPPLDVTDAAPGTAVQQ